MAQNTMNGTQAFQDTIAQYLMARAEKDPMFAVKLANPSKTMEQCCQFIIGEVKKSGCCGFTGSSRKSGAWILRKVLNLWHENRRCNMDVPARGHGRAI